MAGQPEPFWGPRVAPVISYFARQTTGSLALLGLVAVSFAFIVLVVADQFVAFENKDVRQLIGFSWDALFWGGIALWALLLVSCVVAEVGRDWPTLLFGTLMLFVLVYCHSNSRHHYDDTECISTRYTPC